MVEWIYEQLNLKEKDEVLELGCGTGELWKNKNLPKDVHVTLSDQSQGMVKDARNYVGEGKGQNFLSDDRTVDRFQKKTQFR